MVPWKQLYIAQTALLVALLLSTALTLKFAGRFLVYTDAAQQVDAIVVLGGECSAFRRTQRGLALYREGYAPRIVFSGGTMVGSGLACSSAQLSLDAAVNWGLEPEAARILDGSQSTYDEAQNVARLAEEESWSSLMLVTDPFHTRRAARTFREAMPQRSVYVVASVEYPDAIVDRWWRNEASLLSVVAELIKLGYYWSEYGIAPIE
jgi:uncharacterized SAM-binding protein YcdF (DUF218 family)